MKKADASQLTCFASKSTGGEVLYSRKLQEEFKGWIKER
jgi:hypothetical protein